MSRRTPYRRCNFLAFLAKNCHRSDTSLHRKQTSPWRQYLFIVWNWPCIRSIRLARGTWLDGRPAAPFAYCCEWFRWRAGKRLGWEWRF